MPLPAQNYQQYNSYQRPQHTTKTTQPIKRCINAGDIRGARPITDRP